MDYATRPLTVPRLLRGSRQPLYSRVFLRPRDTEAHAFLYAQGQAVFDGRPTTAADTNMNQAGQLGTPLVFDLEELFVHPCLSRESWNIFGAHDPVLRFVLGDGRAVYESPVSIMALRMVSMTVEEEAEIRIRVPDYPEVLARIAREIPLPRFARIRVGGAPLRIESTTAFHAEIRLQRPWSEPSISFLVAMHGILYSSI